MSLKQEFYLWIIITILIFGTIYLAKPVSGF